MKYIAVFSMDYTKSYIVTYFELVIMQGYTFDIVYSCWKKGV